MGSCSDLAMGMDTERIQYLVAVDDMRLDREGFVF